MPFGFICLLFTARRRMVAFSLYQGRARPVAPRDATVNVGGSSTAAQIPPPPAGGHPAMRIDEFGNACRVAPQHLCRRVDRALPTPPLGSMARRANSPVTTALSNDGGLVGISSSSAAHSPRGPTAVMVNGANCVEYVTRQKCVMYDEAVQQLFTSMHDLMQESKRPVWAQVRRRSTAEALTSATGATGVSSEHLAASLLQSWGGAGDSSLFAITGHQASAAGGRGASSPSSPLPSASRAMISASMERVTAGSIYRAVRINALKHVIRLVGKALSGAGTQGGKPSKHAGTSYARALQSQPQMSAQGTLARLMSAQSMRPNSAISLASQGSNERGSSPSVFGGGVGGHGTNSDPLSNSMAVFLSDTSVAFEEGGALPALLAEAYAPTMEGFDTTAGSTTVVQALRQEGRRRQLKKLQPRETAHRAMVEKAEAGQRSSVFEDAEADLRRQNDFLESMAFADLRAVFVAQDLTITRRRRHDERADQQRRMQDTVTEQQRDMELHVEAQRRAHDAYASEMLRGIRREFDHAESQAMARTQQYWEGELHQWVADDRAACGARRIDGRPFVHFPAFNDE